MPNRSRENWIFGNELLLTLKDKLKPNTDCVNQFKSKKSNNFFAAPLNITALRRRIKVVSQRRQKQADYLRSVVQYCAKVMRSNFDESRPLFLRYFPRHITDFSKEYSYCPPENSNKNYHGQSKICNNRESSKKRTFKTAKSRRINAPRRGKIIELSRLKQTTSHHFPRAWETFSASVLVPEGSLLVKRKRKFLRPKTCSIVRFNVTRTVIQFDQTNVNFEAPVRGNTNM